MPKKPENPSGEAAILTLAVENVFRKLIRFLVGRISLVRLQEMIRYVYVEEAEKNLRAENPGKNVPMTKLLKIFLPYSLLAGIGIAIWVSCNRPGAEAIVVQSGDGTPTSVCSGCGSGLDPKQALTEDVNGQSHFFCCPHCRKRSL